MTVFFPLYFSDLLLIYNPHAQDLRLLTQRDGDFLDRRSIHIH